jgi:hypothetical protein
MSKWLRELQRQLKEVGVEKEGEDGCPDENLDAEQKCQLSQALPPRVLVPLMMEGFLSSLTSVLSTRQTHSIARTSHLFSDQRPFESLSLITCTFS